MKKNFYSLLRSFGHAVDGICFTVLHERNMRVHLVCAVYVLLLAGFYRLPKEQYSLLLLCIALVLITELMNTSVEAIVNNLSPQYNQHAKIAKDVAAGAVLLSALLSVVVGVLFLWDVRMFEEVVRFFFQEWYRPVLLGLSLVASALFIFCDNR